MPGSGSGGGGGANVGAFAIGAYNTIAGMVNTSKANEEARILEATKPIKKTSQFDRDNLALAQSEFDNGISAETQKAYDDSQDRSLSTAISMMLKGGGSVNNVGDIYDSSERGRQQYAVMADNLRLKKIEELMKQNLHMADDEEKNWLVNDYGPYINKAAAIGEAKKKAAEQTAKGLDTVAGAFGGGGGGGNMMGMMGGGGGSQAHSDNFSGGNSGGGHETWGWLH